jgi:hypothetical protein
MKQTHMKKYNLILLALSVTLLGSCQKEYADIGVPSSKIEGVVSDWTLSKFVVTDKAGVIEESLDMSEFFAGSADAPNIQFDINGTDTTYTCDTTGLPINVFGSVAGRWRFDNDQFPTKITLIPNEGTPNVDLKLLGPIRETDQFLKISIATNCGAKTAFTYDMDFTRSTN